MQQSEEVLNTDESHRTSIKTASSEAVGKIEYIAIGNNPLIEAENLSSEKEISVIAIDKNLSDEMLQKTSKLIKKTGDKLLNQIDQRCSIALTAINSEVNLTVNGGGINYLMRVN